MNPLLALALATPVWGFTLQPPMALSSIAPRDVAQIRSVSSEPLPRAYDVDAETVAHNDTIMDLTRGFQLAATISMAVTAVFGAIQFGDEYGFHGDYSQTACANGNSVFDYCGRTTPIPHITAVGATAGLGLAALVLTTQVNYDLAGRIDGDWRTYEITRWVGLGMMAVQAIGGFLIANSVRFGWADQQGDFDTLQALSIGHMAWGAATLALETYNTALLF
jgi:hypothetical protein